MNMSLSALTETLALSERIHRNLPAARLVEEALNRGEGSLAANGALSVTTGTYTGRSPRDKYVVAGPAVRDEIAWGADNQPMQPEAFDRLFSKALAYMKSRELFIFDGFAAADPQHRLPIRVINEYAWQNLFAHQLFIRPDPAQLQQHTPEYLVIYLPGLKADPAEDGTRSETFICISFDHKVVLIGGTEYAGEMKKSIFTVMNYLLPHKDVFPMHCSANVGRRGDVALFFGLSGTGKTTLSADPDRALVGDDEHGWGPSGIFNIEGGCYAKCINLSAEKEPQIHGAIRFGTVLENVVVDPQSRRPDYDDDRLTENTRAAYPVDYIPNALLSGVAGHPRTIIFLTADAFGVLPPIARLSKAQAMYHFISGYTSKLAGTERGITEPEATFSPCFGGPFLPLPPARYAQMLGEQIDRHQTRVFLLNTGWSGGPYGVGRRIQIAHTRAMVAAALDGTLEDVPLTQDPVFGLMVPARCPDVPDQILRPRTTWSDPDAYDQQARQLARLFAHNFDKFQAIPASVREAGPRI